MSVAVNNQSLSSVATLSPLKGPAKTYVVAIGVMGLVSFLSCAVLFLFITYRLLRPSWTTTTTKRNVSFNKSQVTAAEAEAAATTTSPNDDMIHHTFDKMTLGANHQPALQHLSDLTKALTQQEDTEAHDPEQSSSHINTKARKSPSSAAAAAAAPGLPSSNSFLTLIYHLLVADMIQALAYVCSLTWWRNDGIFVPSANCVVQGMLIQLGSVSVAMFLVFISLNTLLAMTWGYKFSHRIALALVVGNWVFCLVLVFISVGFSQALSTEDEGWYYARSASLCWINIRYAQRYGFWLQNFWIILSIGITFICYGWIFVSWVRRRLVTMDKLSWFGAQGKQHLSSNTVPKTSGHHPAFFAYPVIYIICSGPIIFVGLVASADAEVTRNYLSIVSVISSLSGLLDAMLWSTTIIFSTHQELEEVGLGRYDFVRTPARLYGNIVSVEGATRNRTKRQSTRSSGGGKWRKLNGSNEGTQGNSLGSVDIRGEDAIRLDTITTVTVDYLHRP